MKLVHGQTKGAVGPMVTAGVAATVVATVAAEVVDPGAEDSEDTESLVITYAPIILPFSGHCTIF
jgi:hypothetical protein